MDVLKSASLDRQVSLPLAFPDNMPHAKMSSEILLLLGQAVTLSNYFSVCCLQPDIPAEYAYSHLSSFLFLNPPTV